jgi:hypothetical protein
MRNRHGTETHSRQKQVPHCLALLDKFKLGNESGEKETPGGVTGRLELLSGKMYNVWIKKRRDTPSSD